MSTDEYSDIHDKVYQRIKVKAAKLGREMHYDYPANIYYLLEYHKDF